MKKFRQFLKEGGNAIVGSVRINYENMEATIDKLYKDILPKLKLSKKDIALLGSAAPGKKRPGESSGDLDVAVDIEAFARNNKIVKTEDVIPSLEKILRKEFKLVNPLPGLGIVTVGFPIVNVDGKQEGQHVQMDFMLSDNLEFSQFAYWSPASNRSKYKGVYRTVLLGSIAAAINTKVLKSVIDDNGLTIPVEWTKDIFDNKRGLITIVKNAMSPKGNILKNPKTVSFTQQVGGKEPIFIIKTLLGPNFSIADAESFESLFSAINSSKFVHKQFRNDIFKRTVDVLENVGVLIPKELEKYA